MEKIELSENELSRLAILKYRHILGEDKKHCNACLDLHGKKNIGFPCSIAEAVSIIERMLGERL